MSDSQQQAAMRAASIATLGTKPRILAAQGTASRLVAQVTGLGGLGATEGEQSTPMTPEAAARVQAAEVKAQEGGAGAEVGGFAARAQSAAAKNAGGQQTAQQSGQQQPEGKE
jgi:hypothetical protein